MTSSTVSRLSAPRSSTKLAFSVTLASSTPRCSTTIFFTRAAMSLSLISVTFPLDCPWRSVFLSRGGAPSRGEKRGQLAGPPPLANAGRRARRGAKPASDHGHAAVDVQRLPGDIGRLGAGEEGDRRGDLVARAHAASGNRGEQLRLLLVVERAGHRADDETGRDAVDGDAARGDLAGERLG